MKEIIMCHVYLTRRCNLSCPYCGVIRKEVEEVSFEKWRSIFSHLSPFVEQFNIFGGEPTLYPEIEKVVEFLSGSGIDYVLSTNGLVDFGLLDRLIDLGLRKIAVSVDSLVGSVFTSSRMKSLAGINILKKLEGRYDIKKIVGVVVTNGNVEEVVGLVEYFAEKGWVSCINLLQVDRRGREWGRGSRKLMITEKQINDLADSFIRIIDRGVFLGDSRECFEGWKKYGMKQNWKCFPLSSIGLDADGSLMCCPDYRGRVMPELNPETVTLGELREASEKDIKTCSGCYWNSAFLASSIKEGKAGQVLV